MARTLEASTIQSRPCFIPRSLPALSILLTYCRLTPSIREASFTVSKRSSPATIVRTLVRFPKGNFRRERENSFQVTHSPGHRPHLGSRQPPDGPLPAIHWRLRGLRSLGLAQPSSGPAPGRPGVRCFRRRPRPAAENRSVSRPGSLPRPQPPPAGTQPPLAAYGSLPPYRTEAIFSVACCCSVGRACE
jgi:hypothetical protein